MITCTVDINHLLATVLNLLINPITVQLNLNTHTEVFIRNTVHQSILNTLQVATIPTVEILMAPME